MLITCLVTAPFEVLRIRAIQDDGTSGGGARETEAMRSVCAPGAASCPVTIARGSTRARHDPTLTPYPAFVAGVPAERMGKETARRPATRAGGDPVRPGAAPGRVAARGGAHGAGVAAGARGAGGTAAVADLGPHEKAK